MVMMVTLVRTCLCCLVDCVVVMLVIMDNPSLQIGFVRSVDLGKKRTAYVVPFCPLCVVMIVMVMMDDPALQMGLISVDLDLSKDLSLFRVDGVWWM